MSAAPGQDEPVRPTARQTAMAGARQAMGRGGRRLHALAQLALLVCLLAGIGIAAVAVRLAQGPWEVAWLARRITENTGSHVTIGRAALAWEGLHGGLDLPLDLVLSDVSIADSHGRPLASIPSAEVSVGVAALLRGKLALRAVRLDDTSLTLRRDEDGTLSFGGDGDASGGFEPGMVSGLRRVQLRHGTVHIDDRKLGITWAASQISVDVLRNNTGADGTASALLSAGNETAQADVTLTLPQAGGMNAAVTLSPVNPAHLAALAADFAPLAALDAAVTLSGSVVLDAAFAPVSAAAHADLGAGIIHVGTGVMPIRAARLSAIAKPEALDLTLTELRLQARDAAVPTNIAAHVIASRAKGQISAQASIDLDQVAFADLAALWPEGTGGPGTRPWITKNITAGTAHNGHVAFSLSAPEDFSDATLTEISGGIDGSDVTTHWLRPVPPVEHGTAHVTFVDPDTLDVVVEGGTQSGTKLAISQGKVRLTGLAGHDQFVAIQANIAGPLADLLTLLKNKKIHLLDRRPMELRDPAGDVSGVLTVSLPLKNDLDIDNVAIRAVGKLASGHVGGIAAGRDLDHAELDYDVGNDGLKIGGTALVASIPAKLQVDMDFRSGPASQVLEHVVASADITPAQLATAGLDTGGRLSGSLAAQLDYTSRRDTSADLQASADLAKAGVALQPSAWRKEPGTAGKIEAHVKLLNDRVTQIDHVSATAPGLSVQASADASGGRPGLLHIQRAVIGDTTDFHGELRLPAQTGQPYVASLSGPKLDLSWMFEHKPPQPKSPQPEPRGPAYQLQAKLGRVLMAGGKAFGNVAADVSSDGLITTHAEVSAESGDTKLSLSIQPQGGGRILRAQAADAGAMLRAFDVLDEMQGGTLSVTGSYDDRDSAHTLRGNATIEEFRITKAPAMAKLLQGMSLYGLVNLVQGPGLGFTRVVAPFGLSHDALTLDDARAYNASLGLTAKGRIDLAARTAQLEGTVVPAYIFNSLLGRIPFLGRVFSPEQGGGVFAASYSVRGALDDPTVTVNPLAALTPGFLRGFFDIFKSAPKEP